MATIKDVARLSAVSVCTVSKVLNRHPKAEKIREETRRRIFESARQLGYKPSMAGRNFRLRRTFLVALVVNNIEHDFWFGLVRAVADELGDGFNVIISNTDGRLDREKQELENLAGRNVDAVILLQTASDERHLENLARHCPLVLLEKTDNPLLSYVKGDDYRSGYELTRRCIADGHRRIAFLVYEDMLPGPRLRLQGARDAAKCFDDVKLETFVFPGSTDAEMTEIFLPHAREFSLALCCEDSLAGLLLKLSPRAGLRIPADLSLIGWNNSEFLRYLEPGLTSVAIPLREIGRRAARIILKNLNGDPAVEKVLIEEDFISRESYRVPAPQT